MTSPSPQSYMPGASTPTGPAQPAPKKSRTAWIVAAAVALLVVIGGTVAVTMSLAGGDTPAASPAQPVAEAPAAAPAVEAPQVETRVDPPKLADFKLAVKVVEKQCFGSAGCNLTYRIDVTFAGDMLALSRPYEVTYEVKGAEDPIVGRFTIDGTEVTQTEETAQTASSAKKLTVKATGVTPM